MRLHLTESSDTATVGGVTLSGPGVWDVDSATVGGTEYGRGVVVVKSGTAHLVKEMTDAGIWATFGALLAGIFAGLHLARAWAARLGVLLVFVCLSPAALADFHRVHRVITNSSPDFKRYRATIYEADITSGAPDGNQYAPAATHVWTISNTAHRAIQAQVVANNGTTVLWTSSVIYTNPSNAVPGTAATVGSTWNVVRPDVVHSGTGPYYLQVRIWNTSLSAWGSYNPWLTLSTSTHYGANTWERGAITNQWEFELNAYASITLNIEQAEPFYLVVDELKQTGTPDGGYAFTWDELEENTSTLHTSSADPESTTEVGQTNYDSGATPAATARPYATADTTAKLDANQEARSTDEKKILEQIRESSDAGVNATSGAAKQARSDAQALSSKLDSLLSPSASDTSDAEAAEAAADEQGDDQVTAMKDALEDIGDEVGDLASKWNLSVSTAAWPAVSFPIPAKLGGGSVVMDFENWAGWFSLLRALLLVVCVWRFIVLCLSTIREGVS